VARRHGDFAIIVIAVIVEGKRKFRLGVGGMAGRPAMLQISAANDAAIQDAIAALVSPMESYEDMHATAEMRRDMLRNLAPVVINEALQCAA
jgi:2-furoyl-CoA dehydrogenase FAD binding subunit